MIVVDSSAIFAMMMDEEDAPAIAESLMSARRRLIGAPTLLECHFVAFGRYNVEGSRLIEGIVARARLSITEFTQSELSVAIGARLAFGKGTGHPAQLNYGDCFSYALAKTRDLPLLYKGDDFVHTDIRPALRVA